MILVNLDATNTCFVRICGRKVRGSFMDFLYGGNPDVIVGSRTLLIDKPNCKLGSLKAILACEAPSWPRSPFDVF